MTARILYLFSAMMPLWIYTLGRTYLSDDFKIVIPYTNLLQVIATMIVPLLIGIAIKWKSPKAAVTIIKFLKPFTAFIMIVVMTLSLYSNWFIFQMITGVYVLAGCMLPYIGFVIGGLVAWAFRQPRERVITISLETGMQNIGIAFLLLLVSFPPPIGDIAAVAPMASGMMTPWAPFLVFILLTIYKKCCGKYEPVNADEQEKKVTNEGLEMNGKSEKVNESLQSDTKESLLTNEKPELV